MRSGSFSWVINPPLTDGAKCVQLWWVREPGFNPLLLAVHSVFHLGLHAGPTGLCAHEHLQRAAPHAQLHHGQQPTYASKAGATLATLSLEESRQAVVDSFLLLKS